MNDRHRRAADDARLDRLKASLKATEAPPIDPGWTRGVMAEILGSASNRTDGSLLVLQRALRKGAIAAAAVALLTAGLALFNGHGLGLDLTRLVALEPDALLQLVWLY